MRSEIRTNQFELTTVREMLCVLAFTFLAVGAPYAVHFFAGVEGGRIFLPMPFFVLLSAVILGWRGGLATAAMSPLVSFLISGMPALTVLPFITLQLIILAAVAGILGKKINIMLSILAAILIGWASIGLALLIFSKINALAYVFSGVKSGFLGIALQLILIPSVVKISRKYFSHEK